MPVIKLNITTFRYLRNYLRQKYKSEVIKFPSGHLVNLQLRAMLSPRKQKTVEFPHTLDIEIPQIHGINTKCRCNLSQIGQREILNTLKKEFWLDFDKLYNDMKKPVIQDITICYSFMERYSLDENAIETLKKHIQRRKKECQKICV